MKATAQTIWSRALTVVGMVTMLIGAVDPLEGCVFILAGVAMVTLGAYVGKSRYRVLLNWSLLLVGVGVATMIILSSMGGFGGKTGRSMWWALILLPYPIGWLLGILGATLALRDVWGRNALPGEALHR